MSAAQSLEAIISLTLQAGALVAIAHLLVRFTKNDATRSRIWEACHVVLLLLVVAALTLPHLRWFNPWPMLSNVEAVQAATLQHRISTVVLSIWALGAVASVTLFVAGWWQITRFLKTCTPIDDTAGPSSLSCSKNVPRLLCSPFLNTPFCWQIHRPAIVIPDFVLEFSPGELAFIIRHEMEHLRAAHPLTLFVQRIVEILFWYHPMVWWSSQQAALTREFACDAAAVEGGDDVGDYLRVLLKVVERQVDGHDLPSIDLAFGRGKASVTRRAIRLTALAQTGRQSSESSSRFERVLPLGIVAAGVGVALLWLPIDVLASPRTAFSPWPTWSSATLRSIGVHARDYEPYATRTRLRETIESVERKENQGR